jgi:hypothetical protein
MGRQHRKKRRMSIRQRQKRQKKLAKLREKYSKADSQTEKDQILKKVYKISPQLTKEEFEKPLKNKEKKKEK